MRTPRDAPVDEHGAEVLGAWSPLGAPPPEEDEFEFAVLTALMLSSQTKDEVVGGAVRALKTRAHADGQRFGPAFVQGLGVTALDGLIAKVGFHNNKTKFMLGAAKLLLDPDFAPDSRAGVGRVPSKVDAMLTLPGVGPKMGFLVLAIAFRSNFGVGVDTHMHRIFNGLGWVSDKVRSHSPTPTFLVGRLTAHLCRITPRAQTRPGWWSSRGSRVTSGRRLICSSSDGGSRFSSSGSGCSDECAAPTPPRRFLKSSPWRR